MTRRLARPWLVLGIALAGCGKGPPARREEGTAAPAVPAADAAPDLPVPGSFEARWRELGDPAAATSVCWTLEAPATPPAEVAIPATLGGLRAATELCLRNGAITRLPDELSNLTGLTRLDLGGNRLRALPDLSRLTALTHLDVSHNPLHRLPGLEAAPALTWVDVTGCPLEPTEIERLRAMVAARPTLTMIGLGAPATSLAAALANPAGTFALDLSAAKAMGTLPASIEQLTELRELVLDDQRLRALPPQIAKLTKLRVLSLRDNAFERVPPELLALTGLEALRLDGNRLTALPPALTRLTALTALSVDENRLTALPAALGAMTTLRTLSAARNQLTGLPPELGRLTALEVLDLDDNQLTAIPDEVAGLPALRRLWLWGNQLTALPAALAKAPRLEVLDAGENPLTTVPEGLHATQWLALPQDRRWMGDGDNPFVVTRWPGGMFTDDVRELRLEGETELPDFLASARKLRVLALNGYAGDNPYDPEPRHLTQLEPDEVPALTRLRTLDVGGNRLRRLPKELGKLPRLRTLVLAHNRLRELPAWVYRLEHVELTGHSAGADGMVSLHRLERFTLPDGKPAQLVLRERSQAPDPGIDAVRRPPCGRHAEVDLMLVNLGGPTPPTWLMAVDPCGGIARWKGGLTWTRGLELGREPADLDWTKLLTWTEPGRVLTVTLPRTGEPYIEVISWDQHGDNAAIPAQEPAPAAP